MENGLDHNEIYLQHSCVGLTESCHFYPGKSKTGIVLIALSPSQKATETLVLLIVQSKFIAKYKQIYVYYYLNLCIIINL